MAKKKASSAVPKMTPAVYWEWRTTLTEINIAKLELEIKQEHLKGFKKDLMIAQLQFEKARNQEQGRKAHIKTLKDDYDKLVLKLEKQLGTTIKNKIIDPVTFEIFDEEEL